MEKDAAINLFIKQYYRLLTDSNIYNKNDYKKLKRDFFVDKYRIPGSVRDKEIIDKLVPAIIKNSSIRTLEKLDETIQSNKFLKLSNISAQDYVMILSQLNKDYSDREFLRNLEQDEQIDKLKEQIIKQKEPELMADIEHMRKEKERLDKELVSILDTMEFEEPISYDLSESPLEWWEELNLSKNPFPNSNGFSMIDEKLYDKILVDSKPFQWMLKKLYSDNVDLFGKGFLIAGALGTGKTTFYDFFKPKFILNKIEPIRIIIPTRRSVADYNIDFENQMLKKVKQILIQQNLTSDSNDFEELMYELQTYKNVNGFVIFIDDLHKNMIEKNVFNFLSNLQLYKNRFYGNGLNTAFFISGLPDWKEKILLDQKLNSFFDGSYNIDMPEVSPEQASIALQKRLLAYAKGDVRTFEISKSFLNYIFQNEQKQRTIVGYRAYIDTAKKHFELKQFDVLGLSPSIIPKQILISIQSELEKNDFFKESLNKLIFTGHGRISNNTLNRCLDLMRHIYLEKYVLETSKLFDNTNNLMFLKKLANSKFIIKSKVEKGAWKIHPAIEDLNKQIILKYKYSFEDYIIQIYGINKSKKEDHAADEVVVMQKKIKSFSKILPALEFENLQKLSDEILIFYKKESYLDQILSFFNEHNINPQKLKYLIVNLASLILEYETPSISDIYGKNNIANWGLRFRNLEYLPDFLHIIENTDFNSFHDEAHAAKIVRSTINTFEEIIKELEAIVRLRRMINNIPLKYFNSDIILNLYTISEFINSQSLDDIQFHRIAKKYFKNFEKKFKEYLFIASKLLFGQERFNYYPEYVKIKNYGADFNGPEDCYNEFSNLERSGFEQLFLSNYPKDAPFYKSIIKPIVQLWSTKDLETLYKFFIDFDKIFSHEVEEESHFLRNHFMTFLDLSCKILADFSERLHAIIFTDSFVYKEGSDYYVVYSYKPRGISDGIVTENKYISSIPKVLSKFNISEFIKESDLFIDTFFSDCKLDIDISNFEEIRKILPGNQYPHQIGILLYLIRLCKIKPIQIYGSGYYFISNK